MFPLEDTTMGTEGVAAVIWTGFGSAVALMPQALRSVSCNGLLMH